MESSSQKNILKTIPKTNCSQQTSIGGDVTTLPNKKCKSLVLPNQIFMKKGESLIGFPLYKDSNIGIDPKNGQ